MLLCVLFFNARLSIFVQVEKCASIGGVSTRQKLKKHALPGIEAIIGVVGTCGHGLAGGVA